METRRKDLAPVPSLLLAAPHGRSGKTTVTMALLLALRAQGLVAQPFKKGPDFIDPSWLSLAAGRLCRNLDGYFMDREGLAKAFWKGSQGADLALIEGAMGLYDGVDLEGSGSTAEIAKALDTPVVLVVDATRMTRSVAALVMGFQHFDPEVRIAGVILNRVARTRHENMLRAAIERYCHVPVLGAIPKEQELTIPDRHLGLVPAAEREELRRVLANLEDIGKKHLDIGGLLSVAGSHPNLSGRRETPAHGCWPDLWQPYFGGAWPPRQGCLSPFGLKGANWGNLGEQKASSAAQRAPSCWPSRVVGAEGRIRIGVFLDRVFTFYYPENLEALMEAGAELVRIDSMADSRLPPVDALYIGGGFPEVFAAALEANRELRQDVARAIEDYLPVYAECGGLMYLGRRILWQERENQMVGVLPFDTMIEARPQGHGYTLLEVTGANPFLSQGQLLRGHEFHSSRVVNLEGSNSFAFTVRRGTGLDGERDGIIYKNLLASYNHLHVAAAGEWAYRFVLAAVKHRGLVLGTERVRFMAADRVSAGL